MGNLSIARERNYQKKRWILGNFPGKSTGRKGRKERKKPAKITSCDRLEFTLVDQTVRRFVRLKANYTFHSSKFDLWVVNIQFKVSWLVVRVKELVIISNFPTTSERSRWAIEKIETTYSYLLPKQTQKIKWNPGRILILWQVTGPQPCLTAEN